MARGVRVIAISRSVAGLVQARYGVPPARLRVIPRGVDPLLFDPDQVFGERVHRLEQAWRLPPGARVVMLPARLTRWKGAETLLDALALLDEAHQGAGIVCVLVGDDQGRETFARAIEARAARLGLSSRLRLAGQCDDMPAALMLADVVVSASLKPEPFGRVVIEAQAMGRPVVAFDHGGAAETVSDGVTGFLVPPGDATALAEAIARALDLSETERAELGWHARAAVLAGYTTAAMQTATLAVYREVLGA
jgi:glycosyltransferase involved in cell wall biosynthesis